MSKKHAKKVSGAQALENTPVIPVNPAPQDVKVVETTPEVPPVTVITPPPAKVAKVVVAKVEIPLATVAQAIATANSQLAVRFTKSPGYRILGTKENTEENWKKGLFYILKPNSKGFFIELQLYSCNGGAHLAEFKDRFAKFGDKDVGENAENLTKFSKLGYASRVRMNLPSAKGLEDIVDKATKFINLLEEEVKAVRALVILAPPKKAAAPAAVAPVVSPSDTPAATPEMTEVTPITE